MDEPVTFRIMPLLNWYKANLAKCPADDIGKEERIKAHTKRVWKELRAIAKRNKRKR